MKKDLYRQWFTDQLQHQMRLLTGAVAAMCGLGLIATIIETSVFAFILHFGFYFSSWIFAYVFAFGIMGLMLFFVFFQMPKHLGDSEHEVELEEGSAIIRTAPTMSTVWTYALGSLETDQTVIERFMSIVSLPQRMICAAWFTLQRMTQLKAINVSECSAVMRLLHKKEERVEISDLIEELQIPDLTTTLRNVSLIDGVMFLKQKSMGLSLTRRLIDAMWEWAEKNKSSAE